MPYRRELDPDRSLHDWAAVELARWMKLKDATQKDVGTIIRKDRTLVSKILSGESPLQHDQAKDLDQAWDTGGTLARIIGHAKIRHSSEWREEIDAIVAMAVSARVWSAGWVPALLQTPEYARASFRAVGRTDLDRATRLRIKQQEMLSRQPAPTVRAIIDESALRMPVGDRNVMRAQLGHLLTLADHLVVRVVRTSAGGHIGRDGSFLILTTPDGRVHPYSSTVGPGRLIKDPGEVATLVESFDQISDIAMSTAESISLIHELRDGTDGQVA